MWVGRRDRGRLRPGRGSRNLAGVTRDKPSELRPSDPPAGPPVIVVADDDRVTRDTICSILTRAGYLVTPANDGQEAVEIVGQGGVDLVLLDILMPRLGGIEACRIIKSVTGDAFVPVMLVTVKTDTASRVEGLKIGADDYITKPFEEREMIARIEAMLRIKRLNDHLVSVRQKLERLSVYDELTGLYNFRYLHTRLREEFKRAERYHEPLACVVIDVDNLRMHNERGGQALGDAILRGVADSVRRCVREVDVVARYGGEEFLVILPSTHMAGSVAVAERIWREVRGRVFVGEPGGVASRVAVTVGVAMYPSPDIKTKEALLRAADTALMNAKREGGDRVCVFQQHGTVYTPDLVPVVRRPDAPVRERSVSDSSPPSSRTKP
ncbi:MAG: diguanylate cyclase response regulator [Deltaproteobacteria bacterium HGW-Deltaproteobacteria-20]|nr:MAG: diguanylate cyclase response regulator [Deltaproteobacteria bacterium HGW-Deltaproteobacteria-20]